VVLPDPFRGMGANENSKRLGAIGWSDPSGKLLRDCGPPLVREARRWCSEAGGLLLVLENENKSLLSVKQLYHLETSNLR